MTSEGRGLSRFEQLLGGEAPGAMDAMPGTGSSIASISGSSMLGRGRSPGRRTSRRSARVARDPSRRRGAGRKTQGSPDTKGDTPVLIVSKYRPAPGLPHVEAIMAGRQGITSALLAPKFCSSALTAEIRHSPTQCDNGEIAARGSGR